MFRVDPRLGGIAKYAIKGSSKTWVGSAADPLIKLKKETEKLLGGAGGGGRGGGRFDVERAAFEHCGRVRVRSSNLHQEQYWAEEEKNEDGQIIQAVHYSLGSEAGQHAAHEGLAAEAGGFR